VAHDTQIKVLAQSIESVTPWEDVLELIGCLGQSLFACMVRDLLDKHPEADTYLVYDRL
jgi:hypothetical protein